MGRVRRQIHLAETRVLEPAVFNADLDASQFGYLSPAPRQRRWNFRHRGAFGTQSSIDPTAMAAASASAAMEWKSTWPDVRRREGRRTNRLTPFWDVAATPDVLPAARNGIIHCSATYLGSIVTNPTYTGAIVTAPG